MSQSFDASITEQDNQQHQRTHTIGSDFRRPPMCNRVIDEWSSCIREKSADTFSPNQWNHQSSCNQVMGFPFANSYHSTIELMNTGYHYCFNSTCTRSKVHFNSMLWRYLRHWYSSLKLWCSSLKLWYSSLKLFIDSSSRWVSRWKSLKKRCSWMVQKAQNT